MRRQRSQPTSSCPSTMIAISIICSVPNSRRVTGLLQHLPHPGGGGGHVDVGYAFVRERVHDRVYDRRLGVYGSRLPDALYAHRVGRGWYFRPVENEVWY